MFRQNQVQYRRYKNDTEKKKEKKKNDTVWSQVK